MLIQEFKNGEADYAFAGSTLALVLLDFKRGVLVVGNLGDSKVLLGTLGDDDQVEDVVGALLNSRSPRSGWVANT